MIVEPARTTDSQLWVFDPQSDGTQTAIFERAGHAQFFL
jgi:hypothetical protein